MCAGLAQRRWIWPMSPPPATMPIGSGASRHGMPQQGSCWCARPAASSAPLKGAMTCYIQARFVPGMKLYINNCLNYWQKFQLSSIGLASEPTKRNGTEQRYFQVVVAAHLSGANVDISGAERVYRAHSLPADRSGLFR